MSGTLHTLAMLFGQMINTLNIACNIELSLTAIVVHVSNLAKDIALTPALQQPQQLVSELSFTAIVIHESNLAKDIALTPALQPHGAPAASRRRRLANDFPCITLV